MTRTVGALSILYPLFITFSSIPLNLCRQGRHQSEWQVVWSSFKAWWEKERCQHKYPSRIRGGHGAAMATVNLHSLSQAETCEPISTAEKHAITRECRPLPLAATNKQKCQFIAWSWLFAHFYCHTGRRANMSFTGLTQTQKLVHIKCILVLFPTKAYFVWFSNKPPPGGSWI